MKADAIGNLLSRILLQNKNLHKEIKNQKKDLANII